MTGFSRLQQAMVDAVNTIELIDPCRSTLSQNIKSCAGMTLKQVISDLRDLNWQECCVTSLENISSSNSNYLAQESGLRNVELPKSKSRKKGSKSKTVDAPTVNNDASFDGNSLSNSSVIGECPGKLVKKRKRKPKDKAGGDSAACSFGSCWMEVFCFFVILVEILRTWKCGVGTSVSSFCAVFLWYFVVLEGVMERAFQKARVA